MRTFVFLYICVGVCIHSGGHPLCICYLVYLGFACVCCGGGSGGRGCVHSVS